MINPTTTVNNIHKNTINDIFTKFCKAAADRHLVICDELARLLTAVAGPGEMAALLVSIANGERSFVERGGLFFTGQVEDVSISIVEMIVRMREKVVSQFGCASPLILINMLDDASLPPYFQQLSSGVGVLAAHKYSYSEKVVIHELTHAAVLTGHHGIDEALAYYMESTQDNTVSLPTPKLVDVESLLALQHIESVVQDRAVAEAMYKDGAAFIHWLVAHSSVASVYEYCRQFSYLTAGQSVRNTIEQYFNVNLDVLRSKEKGLQNNGFERSINELNEAYFSGNLDNISSPLATLQTHVDVLELRAFAALLRGLFASINYFNDHTAQREAQFIALAQRYCEQHSAPSATVYSVNIMVACIQMRSVSSYIEIQELVTHINYCFDEGLTQFPHNGELALMKAKSLHDTPTSQGGDRELAKTFFIKAQEDAEFGQYIQRFVRKYI
nr:hypothetical protein [Lelliottia steviae]